MVNHYCCVMLKYQIGGTADTPLMRFVLDPIATFPADEKGQEACKERAAWLSTCLKATTGPEQEYGDAIRIRIGTTVNAQITVEPQIHKGIDTSIDISTPLN